VKATDGTIAVKVDGGLTVKMPLVERAADAGEFLELLLPLLAAKDMSPFALQPVPAGPDGVGVATVVGPDGTPVQGAAGARAEAVGRPVRTAVPEALPSAGPSAERAGMAEVHLAVSEGGQKLLTVVDRPPGSMGQHGEERIGSAGPLIDGAAFETPGRGAAEGVARSLTQGAVTRPEEGDRGQAEVATVGRMRSETSAPRRETAADPVQVTLIEREEGQDEHGPRPQSPIGGAEPGSSRGGVEMTRGTTGRASSDPEPDRAAQMPREFQTYRYGSGEERVRFTVDGPEGRIRVDLTWHHSELSGKFTVQEGSLLNRLETSLPLLRDLISEQGVQVKDLSVEVGHQQPRGQQGREPPQHGPSRVRVWREAEAPRGEVKLGTLDCFI